MPLLRRSPLIRTTVDLYPGGRVAVAVEPAPSRWPEREGVDRLVVPRYRVADPNLQPPQQAIAYALRHSAARLSEEGRALPAELSTAIKEHRKIAPMAGGA